MINMLQWLQFANNVGFMLESASGIVTRYFLSHPFNSNHGTSKLKLQGRSKFTFTGAKKGLSVFGGVIITNEHSFC